MDIKSWAVPTSQNDEILFYLQIQQEMSCLLKAVTCFFMLRWIVWCSDPANMMATDGGLSALGSRLTDR